MDYRALLIRYMAYVLSEEGVTFVDRPVKEIPADVTYFRGVFTEEEVRELWRLDDEARRVRDARGIIPPEEFEQRFIDHILKRGEAK